jgi:hypothetical protein
MLRLASLLVAGAPLLLSCGGFVRQGASDARKDEDTVRSLEEAVAAATERNDADALAPHLAPDFTFVNRRVSW